MGKPRASWTPGEDRILRESYSSGGLSAALAEIHWRSRGGVEARRAQLGIPVYVASAEARVERAKARRSRELKVQKAKRVLNEAAGKCRCGNPRKPRKRRCDRCLVHAGRWSYKKRYGVAPVAVCVRCAASDIIDGRPRLRRAWAMPGSDCCARHQSAGTGAEESRIARLAAHAERIGHPVDRRLCACGKHLVTAGGEACRFCERKGER